MYKFPDIYTEFVGDGAVCFLSIPKNASSSIRNYYQKVTGKGSFRRDEPGNQVFVIIRDVFTRCFSAYNQLIKHKDTRSKNFQDYLTRIEENGIWDVHQISQSDYLQKFWDNYPEYEIEKYYDFAHLEELERDLNIKLPHLNKAKKKYDFWQPEDIARIQEIYKEDWYLYFEVKR